MSERRERLHQLLTERADRVGRGSLSERNPLHLVVRGEPVSARLYQRYNGTWILAFDIFVDDAPEHPDVFRWIATRSAVMPFAAIRADRTESLGEGYMEVLLSHSLVADSVTGDVLDEVLDGMTFMARRTRTRLAEIADAVDQSPIAHTATDEPEDDPADLSDRAAVAKPPSTPAARTTEAILADLDRLVGLAPVKAEIRALVDARSVAAIRERKGLAAAVVSPHLVFTGNPGTGKTTVARLVGELYRSIGLLPSGHLVEVDRANLVGGYVGQTALKTKAACERARGGVLFIDEAYSLSHGGVHDYGTEAIEALLTFMEANRGELAVVVAGYPEEMAGFLRSNPGLQSRFDLTIEFPDYSPAELERMFVSLATAQDYDLTPDALERLRSLLARMPRGRGFGNGREVRRLFHAAVREHASGLAHKERPDTMALRTLTADVFPQPAAPQPRATPGYL